MQAWEWETEKGKPGEGRGIQLSTHAGSWCSVPPGAFEKSYDMRPRTVRKRTETAGGGAAPQPAPQAAIPHWSQGTSRGLNSTRSRLSECECREPSCGQK